MALSGSGGGDGEVIGSKRHKLIINEEKTCPSSLINGKDAEIYFTATSAKDSDGLLLDNNLTITWTLSTTVSGATE